MQVNEGVKKIILHDCTKRKTALELHHAVKS